MSATGGSGPDPAVGRPSEPGPGAGRAAAPEQAADDAPPGLTFDRHVVLEQLGGWRGMVDASLPTIAFVVANAVEGLRAGIWAALGAALLVFALRLVRRESVQQAISGLFAVAVAVAIAAASGQARDYFVLGIIRNAAIGVVLLGSIAVRWPLVGLIAEFLAPSHLGAMATHSLPRLGRGLQRARAAGHDGPVPDPVTGRRAPDPEPDLHWREDRRMLRAYSWLTFLWGAVFLLRVAVQAPLYYADEVEWLGTVSVVLGLPVTAVAIVVTLWVVARLHRHRAPGEPAEA